MPLHPKLQAMLDKVAGAPPLHTVPVAAIRATDNARYDLGVPKDEVASAQDRHIPGPRGDIRIRIYRPNMGGKRPVIMFFHGSGFVICSVDTHDAMCRQICSRSGAVVVSVDYGLAPENKFPAAPDDCFAATQWAAEHAAEFGGDPARLAVCGDSVGGTMAAVTAIRACDAGGPKIAAQVLLYPVTDYYSAERPSYVQRGTSCGLTRDAMRWFWDLYLAFPQDGAHPHASPIRATSLAGLPRAYVITAEYDLLRDEGDDYAKRLGQAGVPVDHVRYDDMNHGFLNWVGLVDRSSQAMDATCAWLRKNL